MWVGLRVYNHANYGQVCRIHVEGKGWEPKVWIDAGATMEFYMGHVPAGDVSWLFCQRRAATGDAGIGGYLYYHP